MRVSRQISELEANLLYIESSRKARGNLKREKQFPVYSKRQGLLQPDAKPGRKCNRKHVSHQ